MSNDSCLACGFTDLFAFSEFTDFPRITSDSRPFPAGGRLRLCNTCGLVQKRPDRVWLDEIAHIYDSYAAYWQAGGDEQIVFDAEVGRVRRRSDVILDRLFAKLPPAQSGRALDIGCATGVTLQALSTRLQDWKLFGHDIDDRNLKGLESISGFSGLFTGDLADIRGQYDQISLIHVLEHLADPLNSLGQLQQNLLPSGKILIELPNLLESPFDILVADHLVHFSPSSLQYFVIRAGFKPVVCETAWVRKEITLLAGLGDCDAVRNAEHVDVAEVLRGRKLIVNSMAWLKRLVESAVCAAKTSGRFGLFGTSIAATWLATNLGDSIDFFVDEDPSRAGQEFLGRPILAPRALCNNDTVFLVLVPQVAKDIYSRLSVLPARWMLPPAIEAI